MLVPTLIEFSQPIIIGGRDLDYTPLPHQMKFTRQNLSMVADLLSIDTRSLKTAQTALDAVITGLGLPSVSTWYSLLGPVPKESFTTFGPLSSDSREQD